jgi:hypothetical protein
MSCAQPGGPAPEPLPQGEWRVFQGTWTAAGTRQMLQLEADHHAWIFDLTGSLLLTGGDRPAVGFQARAIGFADSLDAMHGASVWTDERGDRVYSQLRAEMTDSGHRIAGTITGGTGRYADVTGDYAFRWQYMVESGDGAVSGRVVNLEGRVRLGGDASAEPAEGRKP